MKAHLSRFSKALVILAALFGGSVLMLTASIYLYLSPELPSADTLRNVRLQTPLRVYTQDHRLIAEFGEARRNPLAFNEIPPAFIHAILAAEDDSFYKHSGVDIPGLLRATAELVLTGSIQSGGSTITMQVARNFFLTAEQSFIRKFNEILLAFRIEDELTKDEILTLYANKIFLGNRAYGVEAAARVYYGVTVAELELHQLAMIAGLPKAPSSSNPLSNLKKATERRDWILGRMLKLGYIDEKTYKKAVKIPDNAGYHSPVTEIDAPYAAEMARQEAISRWGLKAYDEGYVVITTLDSKLQTKANEAMRHGLASYDWRHGYRGPEQRLAAPDSWATTLQQVNAIDDLAPAIVTGVKPETALLLLKDGSSAELALKHNKFRLYISEDSMSGQVANLTEVFNPGVLIRVKLDKKGRWTLSQIPAIQGALVAIDPHNGAIRSLVGGYSFSTSNFNRATQAIRQPGSNFKPFIYTIALEKGMSPATLINDAPVVFHDAQLEKVWRPENDTGKFYGPTPLRKALYLSRNVVSIRVLRQIGVKNAINGMGRFGFDESTLPHNLSLALGTLGTTPLTVAQAYTVFANGGYKVDAYLVDLVETLDKEPIYKASPATACPSCGKQQAAAAPTDEAESLQELLTEVIPASATESVPENPAKRIVDERVIYMMDSILKDVILKGTGRKALALNRKDIGGKTGTTNGPRDAWFSGYSPHMVTSVWVGFDENLLMGRNEYGGSSALPIWMDFMAEALKDKPEIMPSQPPGPVTVKVDANTGRRTNPGAPGVFEYFLKENSPTAPSNSSYGTSSSGSGAAIPEDLF